MRANVDSYNEDRFDFLMELGETTVFQTGQDATLSTLS